MQVKTEINLTGEASKEDLLFQQFKRKSRHFAVFVLSLFALASFVVLVALFILNRQMNANENNISLLKTGIKKYEKRESSLVIIANRIDAISSLLKTRTSYTKAIADLRLILTPDFIPQTLEIGSDGNLKISGSCPDSRALAAFDKTVEQLAQDGKYSKVIYPSVGRQESGGYSVSLELKK